MSLSYQIKSADGQIYGPASIDDLKTWIGEGRVDGETQVSRSDAEQWVAARSFPSWGWGRRYPSRPRRRPRRQRHRW